MEEKWLKWAKRLQAIAQAGLTYSNDKYDLERFEEIREISIEIMSEYTEISKIKIKGLFANENGYQTPKVDIRAAIFKENKILLVKEKTDNFWAMPGGWAEVNLSLKENIIKEVKEEAGIDIIPKKVIAILDRYKDTGINSPYGIYKIFILCTLVGGKFKENIETEKSDFFSLDNLPELSIGRNTKKQIERCFNVKYQQQINTIFN